MSDPATLFVRTPEALWRRVGDEIVIAGSGRDDFERLSPIAAVVWELLEEPITLESMVDRLAGPFDADAAVIEEDLGTMIARLVEMGFVQALDGEPSGGNPA